MVDLNTKELEVMNYLNAREIRTGTVKAKSVDITRDTAVKAHELKELILGLVEKKMIAVMGEGRGSHYRLTVMGDQELKRIVPPGRE